MLNSTPIPVRVIATATSADVITDRTRRAPGSLGRMMPPAGCHQRTDPSAGVLPFPLPASPNPIQYSGANGPVLWFQAKALIIHFPKLEPGLLSYHTIGLKTFNPLEVSDSVEGLPPETPIWGASIKTEGP